jgi:hypothetical protein
MGVANIWRRALAGDQTAVPHIEPLLATDSRWFQFIARIWLNDFLEATDLVLSNLKSKAGSGSEESEINERYKFANLLQDIPRDDAEKLLVSNWEHLRFSRLFIQLALYLGTDQCIRLASLAVEMSSPTENIFEHIEQFFGFNIQGLSDKLSMFHLENLQLFFCKN